jgi:hypothetical protein
MHNCVRLVSKVGWYFFASLAALDNINISVKFVYFFLVVREMRLANVESSLTATYLFRFRH